MCMVGGSGMRDVITLNQFFMQNGYNTVGVGKVYHNWEGPGADVDNWTSWFDTAGYQYYTDPETIELGKRQAEAFGVEFRRGPTTEAAEVENAAEMYHDGYRSRVAVRQVEAIGCQRGCHRGALLSCGWFREAAPAVFRAQGLLGSLRPG